MDLSQNQNLLGPGKSIGVIFPSSLRILHDPLKNLQSTYIEIRTGMREEQARKIEVRKENYFRAESTVTSGIVRPNTAAPFARDFIFAKLIEVPFALFPPLIG